MRCSLLVPILLLASQAAAQTASQSDWSGGPGVWGPVTSFGSDFYSDSGIECHPTTGGVTIDFVDQLIGYIVVEAYDGATDVHAADIDLDGDMDLVSAAYGADDLSWWENRNGLGDQWKVHAIDTYFYHAASVWPVDINSDGLTDVVASSSSNDGDGVAWWKNPGDTGNTWVMQSIDASFGGFEVYASDVDGDGSMDVMGANILQGLSWWDNSDGSGLTWTEHVVNNNAGPCCVYSDDVDGDGYLDIISNESGIEVDWWENLDGTGITWSKHLVDGNFSDPKSVFAADIDGDGDMDLAGASHAAGSTQDISWWENVDGAGLTWLQHVVNSEFWGAESVWIVDIDEDSDGDVLGASYYDGMIIWWENLDGYGESWDEHVARKLFSGAYSVCAADIDTDGILDVVGASREDDMLAWWDVLTYPPTGWLISSVLDVSCWPDWGALDWTADIPSGTSIAFQARSSSSPDSTSMGPWSGMLFAPCSLHGILPDGQRYFQYKAILQKLVQEVTPTLQSVTVTWEPMVGLDEQDTSVFVELLPISPNPMTGILAISFSLPEPSTVEISVYDLSGRLVCGAGPEEYEPGISSVQLGELGSGIYFARMRAAGFEAIRRFVAVE
jgi:hypothetical protein